MKKSIVSAGNKLHRIEALLRVQANDTLSSSFARQLAGRVCQTCPWAVGLGWAASCPRRPLDAALLKVRWTHLERADWHGHALLAREQAGVPVPFPSSSLLMPNEVQQALTDILSAFPLSLASLSFSLSLAPARSIAFFFPSPITYSWNRFNSQHWCLETTRGHRSDSGWFWEWPVWIIVAGWWR